MPRPMKMIVREAAQTTQRVRVGMIGLAAVLLLIGLAAAIFSTANHDRQAATVGGARFDPVANMTAGNGLAPDGAAAKEPLAELGVAPSAATEGNAAADDRAAVGQAGR